MYPVAFVTKKPLPLKFWAVKPLIVTWLALLIRTPFCLCAPFSRLPSRTTFFGLRTLPTSLRRGFVCPAVGLLGGG